MRLENVVVLRVEVWSCRAQFEIFYDFVQRGLAGMLVAQQDLAADCEVPIVRLALSQQLQITNR